MKKKMMALVLCVALVAVAAVGATMAYFTDRTQEVKNTFTVGDVSITLDEAAIDEDGLNAKEDGSRTPDGNKYKLIPGNTYTKDPTVTVVKDSEAAYVRMLVTVKNYDELKNVTAFNAEDYYVGNVFLLEKLVNWNSAAWKTAPAYGFEISTDGKTATYEFRYAGKVAKAATNTVLPALFTEFTIPGTATPDDLEALKKVEINVVAEAIQADNLADEDAAWTAFDQQMN